MQKKFSTPQNQKEKPDLIPVYYQSQTHSNYKIEERTIRNIVLNNTQCVDTNKKVNLVIYYRNKRSASMIMKNNLAPPRAILQQTNLVYSFECPFPHSQAEVYIGLTQTTLSRRLTMHGQSGSIYKHFETYHNMKPTREQLTENTKIIAKANDRYKLLIKEALLILKNSPSINKQYDNFTNILKLHGHRPTNLQTLPNSSNSSSTLQLSKRNSVPVASLLLDSYNTDTDIRPIHSPVPSTDLELDSVNNPVSILPSATPSETIQTSNNNTSITTPNIREQQNLHTHRHNNANNTSFLHHNIVNNKTDTSAQNNTIPPTLDLKLSQNNISPCVPPFSEQIIIYDVDIPQVMDVNAAQLGI